jgi:hypothetical protein
MVRFARGRESAKAEAGSSRGRQPWTAHLRLDVLKGSKPHERRSIDMIGPLKMACDLRRREGSETIEPVMRVCYPANPTVNRLIRAARDCRASEDVEAHAMMR